VGSALTETSWLIDPGVAYLNHGGFGALPRPVADAAAEIRAEIEADPTDVFMRRWPRMVDAVRHRLASFLRADERELVFVANATGGTATVLASLPLQPGDEVVTTDHRYPAVASQVSVLAERGVSVVETPLDLEVPSADAIVDRILADVTARTKLVVVDYIASPTGFVFPVAQIVDACHRAGVPVLVDGAHAPGQLDVDLRAINADFWVGNLHKWVCSPRACAVLRVAPEWQQHIRPLVPSHDYREGFQPAFDWTGTFDAMPLLTIPAALDFWAELGWSDVRRRQHTLATDGAATVAARLGTQVAIRDEFTAAMRLVELPRPIAKEDGRLLSERLTVEHKVTAYVTHHQGRSFFRLCGQLYNTPEHYERLADALPGLLC